MQASTETVSEVLPNTRQYIAPGDSFIVERGAVAAYGGKGISVHTVEISSTLLHSLYTSFWTGEPVWENRFTAGEQPGWTTLEGSLDLMLCSIQPGEALYACQGSMIARDGWITIDPSFQGITGYFAGTGSVMQKLTNIGSKVGRVFLTHAHGKTLREIKIQEEDGEIFIDARHLLGFTSGLHYTIAITDAENLWTRITSKEFWGTTFRGTGSVIIGVGKEIPAPSSANSKK